MDVQLQLSQLLMPLMQTNTGTRCCHWLEQGVATALVEHAKLQWSVPRLSHMLRQRKSAQVEVKDFAEEMSSVLAAIQEVAIGAVGVTATQCGHPPSLLFGRTKCIGHRHGHGEPRLMEATVVVPPSTTLAILWKRASANVPAFQIAIGWCGETQIMELPGVAHLMLVLVLVQHTVLVLMKGPMWVMTQQHTSTTGVNFMATCQPSQ
jgi:hypothetical protein